MRGGLKPQTAQARSLVARLWEFIHPGPDSKRELIQTLADAEERELIEPESLQMLEGVLRMAELSAGDVMVAAPRMDLLDIESPYEELLGQVIDTGHSRFPVFEGQKANIIGILLAKDLLKIQRAPELNLRALLRPTIFIPESKGLNELLRDFKSNRSHMAIVIDEFGNTAGLITIEDVLERSSARSRMNSTRRATATAASTRWPTAASAWPAMPLSRTSTRPSASPLQRTNSTPSAAWSPRSMAGCRAAARRSRSPACVFR